MKNSNALFNSLLGLLVFIVTSLSISLNAEPIPPATGNQMKKDQFLRPNDALQSNNKQYKLIMQGDGNLVLYGPKNNPIWASNTANQGYDGVQMLSNGVLRMIGMGKKPGQPPPIWKLNSPPSPGAYLQVEDDGSLTIYSADQKVVWKSTNPS